MLTKKSQQTSSELSNIMASTWFQNCVNHLNDGILITEAEPIDLPGPRILWANDVFYKLTGYEPSEIIGKSPRILQGPLTDKSVLKNLRTALEKWEVCRVEILNYKKDGSTFWNEFEVTPVANEVGYYTHWIAVQRDITERILSKKLLQKREDHIHLMAEERADELALINTELSFQIKEKDKRAAELILANKEKGKRANELVIANIEKDKRANELILNKKHQAQLERIAHYDILTNLPNRSLLADRLTQAMVQCQRRNRSLAVAFMDLDGFKAVNDTYGHNVGDELLVALSKRMKDTLRESDTLARIGGDEFIVLMADLEKIEDSEPLLERLLKATSDPITLGDAVIKVSASIGVTAYPQDAVDADQLMRHADQAMYVAKFAGKNRYHRFDIAQDNAVHTQRENICAIRSALGRDEFVLYYQPKVDMPTGEVIGVEALIRWQHPVRGLVPPLSFLPLIEGHIVSLELGEWVIDSALSQISQWQKLEINLPVSVNISAYQLTQENFSDRLSALIADHPDVNPSNLELEILETTALSDISQVSTTMTECQALGVSFALDDFGTGYSSLTYLRRLPAHLIKIDQSFVRDMLEDDDDLAIIEGVVGLAKAFNRKVIAEGVETVAHGEALLKLGCELAQGYGIARPMPADDIPEWVSNWKSENTWKV